MLVDHLWMSTRVAGGGRLGYLSVLTDIELGGFEGNVEVVRVKSLVP